MQYAALCFGGRSNQSLGIFCLQCPLFSVANLRSELLGFRCSSVSGSLFAPEPNWRIENGSELAAEQGPDIYHAPVLESQERDSLWYTQHFLGKGTLVGSLCLELRPHAPIFGCAPLSSAECQIFALPLEHTAQSLRPTSTTLFHTPISIFCDDAPTKNVSPKRSRRRTAANPLLPGERREKRRN